MNERLLAVVAVAMITLGIFGLIGLWVYSRLERKPRRAKRHNSDLIVSHRFKSDRRKRRRPAPAALAPVADPGDDSRWRRPGFASSVDPSFRDAMPIFEPNKPRHVFISHTPSVIIPHETVGPAKPRRVPDLGRTQRNQATVLIKTVRVDRDTPYQPSVRSTSEADRAWPAKASVRSPETN